MLGGRQSPKVQPQAPLAGDAEPTWAADLLASTADAMSSGRFTATVNDRCRLCPVRPVCPAVVVEDER